MFASDTFVPKFNWNLLDYFAKILRIPESEGLLTECSRNFLHKPYFLIELFIIGRKEIDEKNTFWNGTDAFYAWHVNIGI